LAGDPSDTGDVELRHTAREAISQRALPARRPDRIWGGPGTGNGDACALCGKEVDKADMAFELEFAEGGGQQSRSSLRMHAQCFAAWELERDRTPAIPERHPAP